MDIVRIRGGLGNQMFEYALVEALRDRGRVVHCNTGYYRKYTSVMPLRIHHVFPNVDLSEINDTVFNEIDERWKAIKSNPEKLKRFKSRPEERFFFVEEVDSLFDNDVFKTKNCTFVGHWQTEKYFSNIREKILTAYKFDIREERLYQVGEELKKGYVSVHIRRGDYVGKILFSNICTLEYYCAAIRYIQNCIPDARFVFFSDDIEWVKQNFKIENSSLYVNDFFEDYQDWYDMYLMSCCSHNIIANSTFGWWGAWLNRNRKKIVIAPKRWLYDRETPDIWCDDWILM